MTQRTLNNIIKFQKSLNGLGLTSEVMYAANNLSDLTNIAAARNTLQVNGALSASAGSYIILNNFTGISDETISVNASSNSTPNTVVAYDANGYVNANKVITSSDILCSGIVQCSSNIVSSSGTISTSSITSSSAGISFNSKNITSVGSLTASTNVTCSKIRCIAITTANIVSGLITTSGAGNIVCQGGSVNTNTISTNSGIYISLNNKYMNYINGMSFNSGGTLFCNSFDDPSHDVHLYPLKTGSPANLYFNYNNLTQINTITCSNISGIGSGLTGFVASQIPALPYLQHKTLWTSPPVSTPSSSLAYSYVSFTSSTTVPYQLSIPFYYHQATDKYARFYFAMYLYSPYNNASLYGTNLSFSIYQSSGPSAPSSLSGASASCSIINGASGLSPLTINLSTLGIYDGFYYLVISDQTISGKTSPMTYVLTDAEIIISSV